MFSAVATQALFCIAALCLRKDFVWYQGLLLCGFLSALTQVGELDYTLPIYAVLSVLPYIKRDNHYSTFALVFIFYNLICLGYALIFQSPIPAVISFLSRVFQFVGFIVIFGNADIRIEPHRAIYFLVFALCVESILGIYLMSHASSWNGASVGQLVSKSHPITGNLAVVLLPLFAYLMYWSRGRVSMLPLMLCLFGFGGWVFLAGIRGYTLVFTVFVLLLLVLYVLDFEHQSRNSASIAIICLCVSLAVGVVAVGFNSEVIIDLLSEQLRLGDSLGIRYAENHIALEFFLSSDVLTKLIGIGTGGTWSAHPGYAAAVMEYLGGSWAAMSYLTATGTQFHNVYACILGLQGLVGLGLLISFFFWVLGCIKTSHISSRRMKIILYAYVSSYALMLLFRWSADCGIGEMVFLACVIKEVGASGAAIAAGQHCKNAEPYRIQLNSSEGETSRRNDMPYGLVLEMSDNKRHLAGSNPIMVQRSVFSVHGGNPGKKTRYTFNGGIQE